LYASAHSNTMYNGQKQKESKCPLADEWIQMQEIAFRHLLQHGCQMRKNTQKDTNCMTVLLWLHSKADSQRPRNRTVYQQLAGRGKWGVTIPWGQNFC
jgi:hypothetical protein